MGKSTTSGAGARTRARELMVQALYQKQIAGHTTAELVAQFHDDPSYERVDQEFFNELFPAISNGQAGLEGQIDGLIDRPLEQLDPIELSILLIGVHDSAVQVVHEDRVCRALDQVAEPLLAFPQRDLRCPVASELADDPEATATGGPPADDPEKTAASKPRRRKKKISFV